MLRTLIPKTINLDIVVTEDCNLNCSYCYMTNRKTKISYNVLEKTFLYKLFQECSFNITFFGGEPLLVFDVIKKFIEKFYRNSRVLRMVLITNAILLDTKKFNFFKEYNVGISVSYDGLWNDKYDLVHATIEENLRSNDIKVVKTIIKPGQKNVVKNVKYLLEREIIPDLTITRDSIWSEEDIKTFKDELENLTNFLVQYNLEHKEILFPGFYFVTLSDMVIGKRNFACGSGYSRFSIMPNGDVYPCSRFGSYRLFRVGSVIENNIDNDILTLFSKENIKDPNFYDKCKGCSIYDFCNSQCQFEMLVNGNYKQCVPLENICSLYKIIFIETARLFEMLPKEKKESIMNNIRSLFQPKKMIWRS